MYILPTNTVESTASKRLRQHQIRTIQRVLSSHRRRRTINRSFECSKPLGQTNRGGAESSILSSPPLVSNGSGRVLFALYSSRFAASERTTRHK